MNLIFISAVSGVGKTTICKYMIDNNLLEGHAIFDIDELENINEYTASTYHLFYEKAICKAIAKSNNKSIVIGSCINPTDIEKVNIPKEISSVKMILVTCSNKELEKRLKMREKTRNCGSNEFIKDQIDYQNYMLNHLDMYQLHVDNTHCDVIDVANQIATYIKDNKL